MCSHTTARSGIIIILLGFIMQFLQYLLSDVTDATNNTKATVALTVDQQIPVVRAQFWPRWTRLKSLRNLDKNTNIPSAKSIYLACVCVDICEAVMLSVCSLRLLVQKKVSVEDLDDKNSVGLLCQHVWRGAHAAPLPLRLCARLSHFVQRKNRGRRGAIGEEHKAMTEPQSQAAQSQLHHCKKIISQTSLLWLRKRPVDEL